MNLSKSKFSFFEFSFIYVVLTTIISQVCIQSALFRAILSLPSFVLLPYLFGELLFFIGTLLRLNRYSDDLSIFRYVLNWFLGFFSIIVLALLLQLLRLFVIAQNLHVFLLFCFFILIVVNRFYGLNCWKLYALEKINIRNSHLILSGLIGLVAVIIVKYFIPFPLPGTGFSDMFFQAIIRMQTHGYVAPFYIRLGDFVVQSLMVQLYNLQPYDIFWIGSFLVVPIFAVGMYCLAKDLTGNSYIGVLSALFAVFINVRLTSQSLFYGTPLQHFRSENIIFAIFPITLVLLNRTVLKQNYDNKKMLKLSFVCGFLFLGTYIILNSSYTAPENFGFSMGAREEILSPIFFLALPLLIHIFSRIFNTRMLLDVATISLIGFTFYFFHKETSMIFSFYIFAYLTLYKMVTSNANRIRILIRLVSLLILLYVFVQAVGIFNFPTTNPFSGFLNPASYHLSSPVDSFQLKFDSLLAANELPTLVLLLIGLVPLLLSNQTKKLLPLALFCFSLLLYFLPDQWAYRAYQVLTPMMAIVLAYSVYWLYSSISSKKRVHNLIFAVLLVAVMIPNLVGPVVDRFSSFPSGYSYHSFMTENEYETAIWLRNNVSEYSVVLSDYKTMQMVVPIADKLWAVSPYAVWMYEDPSVLKFMESLRTDVFFSSNDSLTIEFMNYVCENLFWMEYRYLDSIGAQDVKPQIVVLLTSRTSQWLDNADLINEPLSSSNNVSSSNLGVLVKSKHFSLIHSVEGEIYAFLFNSEN